LVVGVQVASGQTGAWVTCVCDLAVTDVDRYVGDATVTVEYEVTGLQLALGDFLCGSILCCRGPRDALAVLAQGLLAEAGAVPLVTFTISALAVACRRAVSGADGPGDT